MKEKLINLIAQAKLWLPAALTKSKTFFINSWTWICKAIELIKKISAVIMNTCKVTYSICKKIAVIIWKAIYWFYDTIAGLFRKTPAELIYWQDGEMNRVLVNDFVELAPNLIQYEDIETKKRVKVKAEYPIKYVLREQ